MSFELPQYTAEASGVVSFLQPASVSSRLCFSSVETSPISLLHIMAARREMACVAIITRSGPGFANVVRAAWLPLSCWNLHKIGSACQDIRCKAMHYRR